MPATESSAFLPVDLIKYGPPHMAEQKQDDQLEHTHGSYVRIQNVALKTFQRR